MALSYKRGTPVRFRGWGSDSEPEGLTRSPPRAKGFAIRDSPARDLASYRVYWYPASGTARTYIPRTRGCGLRSRFLVSGFELGVLTLSRRGSRARLPAQLAWFGFIVHRNVKRFRGGLAIQAHRISYHSTLGSRGMKKKKTLSLRG